MYYRPISAIIDFKYGGVDNHIVENIDTVNRNLTILLFIIVDLVVLCSKSWPSVDDVYKLC